MEALPNKRCLAKTGKPLFQTGFRPPPRQTCLIRLRVRPVFALSKPVQYLFFLLLVLCLGDEILVLKVLQLTELVCHA